MPRKLILEMCFAKWQLKAIVSACFSSPGVAETSSPLAARSFGRGTYDFVRVG